MSLTSHFCTCALNEKLFRLKVQLICSQMYILMTEFTNMRGTSNLQFVAKQEVGLPCFTVKTNPLNKSWH